MIRLLVIIIYRDDKQEKFRCYDTPAIGSDWITLYPDTKSPLGRLVIPSEAVKSIDWDYEEVGAV